MREDYVGSHKYGSPFAAYLDERCHADEDAGNVDTYGAWYGRFGRHVLCEDRYGFVSHFHVTEDEWDAIVTEWATWWADAIGEDR